MPFRNEAREKAFEAVEGRANVLLDLTQIKVRTQSDAPIVKQLMCMVNVLNMTAMYRTDFEAWANASDEDFLHDAVGILNNFDPAGLGLLDFAPLFTTCNFL